MLFSLFIAEISHPFHQYCEHAFADELTLWYYFSQDNRTTMDMMNEDFCTIELWAMKVDFYQANGAMDVEGLGSLSFSKPIERKDNFCLLGMHLDHGLYVNGHCRATLAAGRRRRNTVSALLGRRLAESAPAQLIAFK